MSRVTALDCYLIYKAALVKYWPARIQYMHGIEKFVPVARLLDREKLDPLEYIGFWFSYWEGFRPPTFHQLADPYLVVKYRQLRM